MRVVSLVAAVVTLALALGAPAIAAEKGHGHHGKMKGKHMMKGKRAGKCPMAAMRKERAKTMSKVKRLLAEAKGAAEAKGNKTAAEKIDKVLGLLTEQKQAMQEHMASMMKMMSQRMQAMQAMKKDLKELSADADAPEGMKQKMKKMHEKMGRMCGGMMMQCKAATKAVGSEEGAVVNDRCPIMGTELDKDDVPGKLTRTFKGKTVGFCCAGCPAKWDKLSDEQKQKKLDAATDE